MGGGRLPEYTNFPDETVRQIRNSFDQVFRNRKIKYRSTGISCYGLIGKNQMTGTLFEDPFQRSSVYEAIDMMSEKFGENSLVLATSMNAIKSFQVEKGKVALSKKHFPVPFMGEVGD